MLSFQHFIHKGEKVMNDYIIITDSGCDIKPAVLKEWGVPYLNLTFRFEGEDREYSNDEMEITEFYDCMRKGGVAKTSAINPEGFALKFEEFLKEGKDILYIGFSSGLSTTCNSARIAADELCDKYPERKILIIDSLAASAGQGMLVYLTLQKQKNGAGLEEAAAYAEEIKLNICHWFTVDDLVYLKRGGRVSPAVAIVGTVLGIKPVLHVDNDGKLISVSKVRGRKNALSALVDRYGETAQNLSENTVYISHADCLEDANEVKKQLKSKYNAEVDIITDVGAVIGAHSGPGTLALFFVGKER